jgi:undecaprenyl-diphosphatase
MSVFQAFIMGLVQGLGEFLPISSSAHLILIPWLFKWPDPGLTFDVALHIGTLLAVIAYFWRDWLTLCRHGLGKGLKTQEGKLFWYIIFASIPGALGGVLLESKVETVFRNPLLIGITLIVMGLLLYLADRFNSKHHNNNDISFWQSMTIGICQALAIIPGISRSGITMTGGLFLKLSREKVARFSFLLSTPIVVGAGLLKISHLSSRDINLPFVVGVITSAVVGFLVIGYFLRWLRNNSFAPFVWYRLILGLGVIMLFLVRH